MTAIKDRLKSLAGKKVLVTGGAGMIGSTIVRKACAAGAEVTVLDNMAPLYGGNLFNFSEYADETQMVYGDIRNRAMIEQVVRDKDIIFNLAAQVSYVDSNLDPFNDRDINAKGHLTVLEACREHAPDVKLIFSSSRFVYGDIEYNPVDERHPFNCLSIYGVNKLNGEKFYQFYHRNHDLSSIIFRIANPYGPRQQMKHSKYGILNWFIRLALEGKRLTVFGEGTQQRDYIFVDDLTDAMLLGAVSDIKFDIFNLGTGTGLAFKDMATKIAAAAGIDFVEWPKDRYFVETGDYISDIARIKDRLNWKPLVSIDEGIARTVEYYREHGKMYWDAG